MASRCANNDQSPDPSTGRGGRPARKRRNGPRIRAEHMDLMGGILKGRSHLIEAFQPDVEVDCADIRSALKSLGLSTSPD